MSATPSFHVGGVRLDALDEAGIVSRFAAWAREETTGPRSVCFVNAFSIASAASDTEFRQAINTSDLCVVDGVPVAWLGRHLAGSACDRLSGPDLMHLLLTDTGFADLRHFIYGGNQDSLDRLEFLYNRAGRSGPRRIVGTYSPPFRDLTSQEESAVLDRIAAAAPDVIWVCLGTAHQEKWMARMRHRLPVKVLAGVGAAVDFLSGTKPRAPRWMQRAGLEWLFRLASEPHRLWRRYLIGNIVFLRLAGAEVLRRRAARGEQP